MNDQITLLHACYVGLTSLPIVLDMTRVWQWEIWIAKGWDKRDLELVIGHIKRGIKEQSRRSGALPFSNLIRDTEGFEETLAEARAKARVIRMPTGRAEVHRATGRSDVPQTAEAVAAGARAIAMLLEFRRTL
jgi:hypothetical protein